MPRVGTDGWITCQAREGGEIQQGGAFPVPPPHRGWEVVQRRRVNRENQGRPGGSAWQRCPGRRSHAPSETHQRHRLPGGAGGGGGAVDRSTEPETLDVEGAGLELTERDMPRLDLEWA